MAMGEYSEIQMEQFKSAVYGSVDMVDWGSDDNVIRPCFYFENSDFFNHKDVLDGAIVSNVEKGELCLNSFSSKYEKLKVSELSTVFGGAVLDPVKKERNGDAYLADTNIDRKKSSEIRTFIQTKYSKPKLIDMDFGHHIATVRRNI
jgi:hypothetical protein